MSEEVTYADLKFQDSGQTEDIQRFDTLGEKVWRQTALALTLLCLLLLIGLGVLGSMSTPAPSRVWRQTALALTLLCLLLLIGLGVLGSMFYIALKTEMEKVNKLQNIKEELERNVSLQLVSNLNISQKIMNLSSTMQEIATKLCYELYRRQAEHKCNPCPKKWLWHENNCYHLSDDYMTWQKSKELCSAEKASLLMIKNKSILEFLKPYRLRGYWLGLSPRNDLPSYQKLDEIFVSSKRDMRNTDYISNGIYCGYSDNVYLSFTTCTDKKKFICEKSANPVNIESTLMIEVPEESV